MAHACVDELAARGHQDVLVLTRNVDETRGRFGKAAVPTLPFPWPPEERAAYLDRVLRAARGDAEALSAEDPVWALIAAMRTCDALLIAGGGNMNSLYGWLLYERAAVAGIARALELPVAIAGQTFGPVLFGRDRDVAADLIAAASFVGARESYSLALGRSLAGDGQHKVQPCLDDASFYAGTAAVSPEVSKEPLIPARPYIAATFAGGHGSADRESYIKAVAATLDQAAHRTGCAVVLLAHMSTPGLADGDEAVHSEIATAMTAPVVAPPILSAEDTAALTAAASMVITSRYHPVVFALDAGVPVVALACEGYSYARLNGALQNWGMGPLALTLPSLFDGSFGEAVEEAWTRRSDIAAHLEARRPVKAEEFASWWDRVVLALGGTGADLSAGVVPPNAPDSPVGDFSFQGAWAGRAALSSALFLPLSAEAAELRVEREHLAGRLETATREGQAATEQLQRWLDSKSFALVRRLAPIRTLVGKVIK